MTTFVIVVFLLFVSVNSFSISLRGRLLFNGSSSKKIDSNSIAEVKLIEISSSRVICETHVRPIGFPIHFVLKFQPDDIDSMENVVIRATVRDLFGLTMYQNEFWTPIVPLGDDRTMFVDISMMTTKNRWPELIGINGEEAVERIKKETGSSCFINVQIHRQGSPMTMDFNTNRVRVIVDADGLVSAVPFIA